MSWGLWGLHTANEGVPQFGHELPHVGPMEGADWENNDGIVDNEWADGGCAHLALAFKNRWPDLKIGAEIGHNRGQDQVYHAWVHDGRNAHDVYGTHKNDPEANALGDGEIDLDVDPQRLADLQGVNWSPDEPWADRRVLRASDEIDRHWFGSGFPHHTASIDGICYAHIVEADVAEDLMKLAMPSQDAYDYMVSDRMRKTDDIPESGEFYHGSNHEHQPGDILESARARGDQPRLDYYNKLVGAPNHADWVWMYNHPGPATNYHKNVYQLEPLDEGPWIWNNYKREDGSFSPGENDENFPRLVSPRARVIRKLSPEEYAAAAGHMNDYYDRLRAQRTEPGKKESRAKTAMPMEDAYDHNWPDNGDVMDHGTRPDKMPNDIPIFPGPWFHGTDVEFKPGDIVSGRGGLTNRRNWAWMTDEPGYASNYGLHTYEVEPLDEGPYPWNGQTGIASSHYVSPRARVIRKIDLDDEEIRNIRGNWAAGHFYKKHYPNLFKSPNGWREAVNLHTAVLSDEGWVSVAEQAMERYGHGKDGFHIPTATLQQARDLGMFDEYGQADARTLQRQHSAEAEDWVNGILHQHGWQPGHPDHRIRVEPEHWDLRGGGQAITDGWNYIGVAGNHANKLSLLHEMAHILTGTTHGRHEGHGPNFQRTVHDLYHRHLGPEAASIFSGIVWPDFRTAARLAMPAPLPQGVHFRYHPELMWSPGVTAHYRGQQIGSLEWYDDDHVMVDLGSRRPGEIDRISVDPAHQGNSVATSMFDFAKQYEPRLHHSDHLTDDGRGWSEYEKARNARLAAAVAEDSLQRLHDHFHDWWGAGEGTKIDGEDSSDDDFITKQIQKMIDAGADIQMPSMPPNPSSSIENPLSNWPTIEQFLKDNYPAAHRGFYMGMEQAQPLMDGYGLFGDRVPDEDPYETGPEAVARHGYDPKEVAAGMLLLHNRSHGHRSDLEEADLNRLSDVVRSRSHMQRTYEQRTPRLAMAWQDWAPHIQGGCESCTHDGDGNGSHGEYWIEHEPDGKPLPGDALAGGKLVSNLSFFHDVGRDGVPELYIAGIHTSSGHRHDGVAEALMRRMHEDHPDTRINPGHMTDDGQAFHDRLLGKEPDAKGMVTAGLNGELPENITFKYHGKKFEPFPDVIMPNVNVSNTWPTASAWDGDRMIGHLQWDDDHPRKKGQIWDLRVHPEYQRRGVATALFDWVTDKVDPDLQHSNNLSDEGRAFAESEVKRPLARERYEAWRNGQPMPKRFAGRNGDLPPMTFEPFNTMWSNGIMARHAEDGRPIAHLHWHPDGEIEQIRVHPELRGRGIAKHVLAHAAAHPETYEAVYGIKPSNHMTASGRAFAKSLGYEPPPEEFIEAADEKHWPWKAVENYVPLHVPYNGQNEDQMSRYLEEPWTPPNKTASAEDDDVWPVWWRGKHRMAGPWDKRWHPNHPQHIPAPWDN